MRHKMSSDTLRVPRPFHAAGRPQLREPKEIGCFSLIGDREYVHSNRKMGYLVEPEPTSPLDWDLNKGFAKRIPKSHSLVEKLDNLLRWVVDNLEKFSAPCDHGKPTGLHTDFVSYRGLLTVIMCSVYETRENWMLGATKYKDTIYLCQYATEEAVRRNENQSAKEERMTSWGYKFEQYMIAGEPTGVPDTEEGVNEKEEYCTIVRSRLNEVHSLLYGAEVDAVDHRLVEKKPDLVHSPRRYVELKTSRLVDGKRQETNMHKFKLVKWWAQSYLIGIPRVICGFRDDSGLVRKLEDYPLSRMTRLGAEYWTPGDCLSFLEEFLTFVKKNVLDGPQKVVLFEYNAAAKEIRCKEVKQSEARYEAMKILPQWYLDVLDERFSST